MSTGVATNVERRNNAPCTSDTVCRPSNNDANNRLSALQSLRVGTCSSGLRNKTSEPATTTDVRRSYSSELGTGSRARKTKEAHNELKATPMVPEARLVDVVLASRSPSLVSPKKYFICTTLASTPAGEKALADITRIQQEPERIHRKGSRARSLSVGMARAPARAPLPLCIEHVQGRPRPLRITQAGQSATTSP